MKRNNNSFYTNTQSVLSVEDTTATSPAPAVSTSMIKKDRAEVENKSGLKRGAAGIDKRFKSVGVYTLT